MSKDHNTLKQSNDDKMGGSSAQQSKGEAHAGGPQSADRVPAISRKHIDTLQRLQVTIDVDLPVAATYADIEEWLRVELGLDSVMEENPLSKWELPDLAKRVEFRKR